MNVLTARNIAAIDQGLGLIEALRGSHGGARVAPHFRHCIDFYDCFLRGAEAGRIDYDARARSPELESELGPVALAFRRIREQLEAMGSRSSHTPVEARADALEDDTAWTASTLGRELLFLLSHTIHHYALIDLLLREEGFEVPRDFGMAPSTLKHLQRQPECAR